MFDFISFSSYCLVGVSTLLIYFLWFIKDKGYLYWKRYWISLISIHFSKAKLQRRLSEYKNLKRNKLSPVEIGFIPSAFEYEIENPCQKKMKHCDGVHFIGTDSEGNIIDVCINKIQENMATVWVFLRLSNGELYKLSYNCDTRKPYIDNEYLFHSSGLQIRCLTPLRKWRISFNGLLQKLQKQESEKEEELELTHVRFSFVWLAMSVVEDLNIDFNAKDLAESIANASHDITAEDISCFTSMQNRYEQWGQLMGTLNIKGKDEKELYLWSIRTRILDIPLWHKDTSVAKCYIYFKDGFPLKIETLSVEDFISNYTSGYSIDGFNKRCHISNCNISLNRLKRKESNLEFSFQLRGEERKCAIQFTGKGAEFYIGPDLENSLLIIPFNATMNNCEEGFGILHLSAKRKDSLVYPLQYPPIILKDRGLSSSSEKFILSLTDEECKSSRIAGGKGCSLALMKELSKKEPVFVVPKGFVITTAAFENHIKTHNILSYAIQHLYDVSCEKTSEDLKDACEKCVEEFNPLKLSDNLKEELENILLGAFGSLDDRRFSVRSSACGEDSEDLSAAGQMLTVLGIRGINNIADAIIKCWSSKFSYEAVQYARQNGQSIREPMALVIQEMVPADFSGVLFTVNPVTGDPSHPYITANYGLGETVVSSLAEPDTIILQRKANNTVSIFEKIIGSKQTQVFMKVGDGVEQKNLTNQSEVACLSDEWAEEIGNVGLLVERCFCGPRDIEWAVHKNNLFLLQARPITTLHTETDFELIHDQDTPIKSVHEYWTRANTGEVFLGASSPLALSLVVSGMDIYAHRDHILRNKGEFCPYFLHILPVTHKQVTLNLVDTLFASNEKEISTNQRAFEVGLFGRIIGNEVMHKVGVKKYGYKSMKRKFLEPIFIFWISMKISKIIRDVDQKLNSEFPLLTLNTAADVLNEILNRVNFYAEVFGVHRLTSFLSPFYNLILMRILSKGTSEWGSELYAEFANLLSSCSEVESADVPRSLQELATAIAKEHGMTFSALPVNTAYNVLKNDKGPAGKLFKAFLSKHGHRCVKEFDLYSESWGMNPESLIPTLQNLVNSPNILNIQEKKEISVHDAIAKLKLPLSNTHKLILKWVLPLSRKAVGDREKSKSMVIKTVDWMRKSCHQLGRLMVQEGLLPDSQLIFFLTSEEIRDLIISRKPGLVTKAIRRKRLHPKLDALQFPEIIEGIPKPIEQEQESLSKYSESFTLTGTPVCQGRVKAKARVVLSLKEASTIQNGDILITNATDIGWSPYFPLLSGVVTVLGGLISHGAVVAREYGLPCVVGVQKATTAFKSGDTVILDGTSGTVTKVIEC
ncbi:uncharacterized protein LOC118186462 isoform X2 [Stegodyphus dumicola]|uniref:uncharacterized protein LOC118186462 isoform X2 n=1 Tax=Stegodyphus dumicola TaxID=202533 RepID=UPI0015AA8C0B|nr:uncharacterized protein LOC118186462 isoform X2 [Stegodyphus dumicola]